MMNRNIKKTVFIVILVLSICVTALACAAVLKKGDNGSQVRKLQKALIAENYDCNSDGHYTDKTVKAVKAYQNDWSLKVDGIAGEATQIGLLGGYYSLGDAGPRVKEFQKLLKDAGYSVAADGKYGKATVAAVKAFQKAAGLTVDGKAGKQTQTALANGKTGYPTVKLGDKGDDVRKVQYALKQKGYYKGTVNGIFDTTTQKAVIKFQKAKGVTADGVVGYKTSALLFNGYVPIDDPTSDDDGKDVDSAVSLYYGCTGSRVRQLQTALKKAGVFKGTIDGSFGQLTKEAVKKYQTKHGLAADGIAGAKTIASLTKTTGVKISTSFVLTIGSKGKEVKSLTTYLQSKGYLSKVSSTYTQSVANAVKSWQADKGKTVTGTITEAQYNLIILGKED